MPEGQNIGDAVLTFLGDTTQLDVSFDRVKAQGEQLKHVWEGAVPSVEEVNNAIKDIPPIPEEVPESIKPVKENLREAKGEAALLGEAFGIHLPRHVRTFVAELPGVGQALNAAFSATAVFFLLGAVKDVAEKLSGFVTDIAIFTEEMKKSNEEVVKENKSLVALADIYNKAKERLDELNGVTKSWEDEQRKAIQTTLDGAKAQLAQMEATIANKSGWEKAKDAMKDAAGTILSQVIPGYYRLSTATQEQIALEEKRGFVTVATANALKATTEVNAEEAAKHAKSALDNSAREIENQKKAALAYAQNDQEKFEIEQHFEEKKLALLNEYAVKDKAAIQALLTTIEVQQIQHSEKVSAAFVNMLKMVQAARVAALNEVKTVDLATVIELTPLQAAFKKSEDAAHLMGITLRTDYITALEQAKKAQADFASSGFADVTSLKAFQAEVDKAQKALDNFGKNQAHFKITSHGLFKQLEEDSKTGADALQQWKQIGTNALSDVTQSAASAFSNLLLAQGSFGQALEKATAQILASVASQAIVSGIFDLAKSYEASARYDYGAAGQYMAAAETMFVVGALAGAGAAGLSHAGGGSGSGGSHAQSHDSVSNTGQSNRSGGSSVGVQAFAEGGLISAPTIALMGEAGREAVIPLDNPSAAKQMRDAGIGGDTHIHLNVHGGLIAESTIHKLCKQISKSVGSGKVTLTASNSLRLTKRSA